MRTLSLAAVLTAFWIGSSGRFDGVLLAFLAGSLAIVIALTRRAGVLDVEGHPTHLIPRLLGYWAWLIWQVVTSNAKVLRILLARRPPISPRVVRLPLTQRDDLARAIVGNSTTLTPGTITVDVGEHELVVHCLTAKIADELLRGETGARLRRSTETTG